MDRLHTREIDDRSTEPGPEPELCPGGNAGSYLVIRRAGSAAARARQPPRPDRSARDDAACEAVTCRSRAEIGIPATSDESFILHDDDTIASVQQAHRDACESSRRATSSLGLDDRVYGYWRGPLPLRWVYFHVLRELAQHGGHADIVREQILNG
jgi:Protein of unknown function (DUF664)